MRKFIAKKMKINIVTIGEPKLSFAKEGFAEYTKRLSGFHKVKIVHMRDKTSDEKLLQVVGSHFCVALDERGEMFTSRALAHFLDEWGIKGVSEMVFVIGGPNGHSENVRKRADVLWSLSTLTFPHDIAMMISAEALYRASTISVGHPYHRE